MASKRQREVALVALAVLLVATIVWRVRSEAPPASAGGSRAGASVPSANQQPAKGKDSANVNIDALNAERPEPVDSDRNPFRFKEKPPPPPPSMPNPTNKTTTMPIDAGPTEPPPPPPIPLKYIGVMKHDDPKVGRVAVLSDTRGVYHGREGDIIEGRYRIMKIGVESIDLEYLDGRGRQTIRQTGQ
jgi:hypothetical protein